MPEGSFGATGIGCHGMALFHADRNPIPMGHMGAEGANWIGLSPYTETPHIFQNLGDGTYSHSGSLAIRAAVNAGVNITYKILFNDAVAMTGGQPVEGELTVGRIVQQVVAEGVARIGAGEADLILASVEQVSENLSPASLLEAIAWAEAPLQVRGFGQVKAPAAEALLERLRA